MSNIHHLFTWFKRVREGEGRWEAAGGGGERLAKKHEQRRALISKRRMIKT